MHNRVEKQRRIRRRYKQTGTHKSNDPFEFEITMNNIYKSKAFNCGYTDVFSCMGFDDAEVCVHTFDDHTLLYVYSGTMELTGGNAIEHIETGGCVFIRKGEKVRLTVFPDENECHVMKMILPRAFLCELYHCQFSGCDVEEKGNHIVGHILPENAATTSLFLSLVPFYEFGMEVPQNLYRLKMTEAILVLLTYIPGSVEWLFDFSVKPLNLLDVVTTHDPTPLIWRKINFENALSLN